MKTLCVIAFAGALATALSTSKLALGLTVLAIIGMGALWLRRAAFRSFVTFK